MSDVMNHTPSLIEVFRPSAQLAEVVLNRPQRRNALTIDLIARLAEALRTVVEDPTVEVILLRGAGGAFCSGLDMTEIDPHRDPDTYVYPALRPVHELLANTDQVVVVALERAAINAGAALALSGDVIVAGEQAFLQIFELSMGLRIPMNLAWLSSRYGHGVTMQLILEGQRITGSELHRLGIASHCVPDSEVAAKARSVADRLSQYPPGSIRNNVSLLKRLRGESGEAETFARLDLDGS